MLVFRTNSDYFVFRAVGFKSVQKKRVENLRKCVDTGVCFYIYYWTIVVFVINILETIHKEDFDYAVT